MAGPCQNKGDRVQGWEIEEGGTNERAETDLNGPAPARIPSEEEKNKTKRMQRRT